MNDCLWYAVSACEGKDCNCDKYLSMNCDKGSKLREEYEKEVEKALEPVINDFAKKHFI